MRFDPPLVCGRLVRRYKRFLCDVRLEAGELVVAHCPNPGSMLTLDAPGSRVWLSESANPARRLRLTWELVEVAGGLVGINTARPNRLVESAIEAGAIPELAGYPVLRREVAYGRASRVDLVLQSPDGPDCYVEIKSVTMRRGAGRDAPAEFPDAVTKRGARHMAELATVARQGKRAVAFFLVQRSDCDRVAVAADIDPAYALALARAARAGVEVLAYRCDISPAGIEVGKRLAAVPGERSGAASQAVRRRG